MSGERVIFTEGEVAGLLGTGDGTGKRTLGKAISDFLNLFSDTDAVRAIESLSTLALIADHFVVPTEKVVALAHMSLDDRMVAAAGPE